MVDLALSVRDGSGWDQFLGTRFTYGNEIRECKTPPNNVSLSLGLINYGFGFCVTMGSRKVCPLRPYRMDPSDQDVISYPVLDFSHVVIRRV